MGEPAVRLSQPEPAPGLARVVLPDLDVIRQAIDEADERGRLLRRLLRVVMSLQVLDSHGYIPPPSPRKS